MDKNIPLSTLIEQGCRITRPCQKSYFEVQEESRTKHTFKVNKACAIGAAYTGFNGEFDNDGCSKEFNTFMQHYFVGRSVIHPVFNKLWDLKSTIVSLNDEFFWPREHIAFWLRTLGL